MVTYTNAKQVIPEVFKQIMETDRAIDEAFETFPLPFQVLKELHQQRKSLSRDAERILRWNTDKGNKP